jgi:hypothetical protein
MLDAEARKESIARMEELKKDPWLARKVNRVRRTPEIIAYTTKYLPEMNDIKLGGFLDIGPGPGELIELAMAKQMDAYGWDAKTPEGGMGDAYLEYSRLSHLVRDLDVTYCNDFTPIEVRFRNALSIINLRGSVEQVLSSCMNGEPHDKHQDCRLLSWDMKRGRDGLKKFLKCMRASLLDNGILMIAGNGAKNTGWYDKAVSGLYSECGFTRMKRFDERTHKFYA